jgi:RNA polymerase sigma-70 factor (ECF subfamily)
MQPLALLAIAAGMDAQEDQSLTAGSERERFESLMRQHERQVLATALRFLGNLDDAKDVAQEAFFRLYRHMSKIQTGDNVGGWLYRVTMNLCRDEHRRRPATVEMTELASGSADPQQELTHAERVRVLELGLRKLPEKERTALILRDLEGLSTAEVAEILGSSEATVRSQISKARVKMKEFTERYFRRRG